MLKYGYEMFRSDTRELKKKITDDGFKPDAIVAIARGGLTMAHFLSLGYDIRDMYVINAVSYTTEKVQGDIRLFNIPNLGDLKNILVVDEIVDSGKSLKKVMKVLNEINPDKNFKTAALFCKPNAEIMPDYHVRIAEGWIDFFWETDCLDES